jgi:hypothetical protein
MVVKRASTGGRKGQAPKKSRYRDARISFRLHPDLRDLLIYLAQVDNRTLSQKVEMILVEYARQQLRGPLLDDGSLSHKMGWDRDFIERVRYDPHPFARDLYARLSESRRRHE